MKYTFKVIEFKKEEKTLELDLPNLLRDKEYLHFNYSGGHNYYVKILPIFNYLPYDFENDKLILSDELIGYDIWVYNYHYNLYRETLYLSQIQPVLKDDKIVTVSFIDKKSKISEEVVLYCLTQENDYTYTKSSEIEFNNKIIQFINGN